jgi:NitT/TauT family transport system substrate-binding protein
MTLVRRLLLTMPILAGALCAGQPDARALDKIHAGKAVAVAWMFVPLDVGVAEGLFAKYGLDVDITTFGGDQKMQVGLASGSIDFGLGGGPAMAFVAKGAPVDAVAAFAGAPRNICILVGSDSAITSVADLKGKLIAASAPGSLTGWLVQRVSVSQGWGVDGIRIVDLGGFESSAAALRTHQIDAMMSSVEAGYTLEGRGLGHILVSMGQYAPVFITHVIFARRALIRDKPDLVRRFLNGFFAAIDFMKTHKAETSTVAEKALQESPDVANKTYDEEITMLETDGHFDPAAVAVIKQSLLEMGTLDAKPRDDQMFTTEFLPVKP